MSEAYPEHQNNEKYVLVVGDIVNGMKFYGPFDTHEDAEDYDWHRHGNKRCGTVVPLCLVRCDEEGNWIG